MFTKIKKTDFPPKEKPILVWDGECGFCKFWVIRLQKRTKDKIDFKTFQEVGGLLKDIPLKEFKKASRLIETDGHVFNGPDSLYRSLYHSASTSQWHRWYHKYLWFEKLNDHAYNTIAKNRPTMFTLTKICFGKDPNRLKPYWAIYLLIIIGFSYLS